MPKVCWADLDRKYQTSISLYTHPSGYILMFVHQTIMLVGVFLGARDIPPRDSLIRAPERRSLAKKKKKKFRANIGEHARHNGWEQCDTWKKYFILLLFFYLI